MYNPYFSNQSKQQTADRIDNQIMQLQQMKEQIMQQPVVPQPTSLTQNFQIAPNSGNGMKYASSIDEVNKDVVYVDTPYFSKDMSTLWIKNAKGEIKSYSLAEIIMKDEKDMQIEFLQAQIEELKKGMNKNESSFEYDSQSTSNEEPSSSKAVRTNKKK